MNYTIMWVELSIKAQVNVAIFTTENIICFNLI